MKVCKFEKIKNEEEIIRIIDCIRNEHPHVVVIPTAIPLQKWLQKISASWFHHEDETSHSIINTIEEYYYTLADHLITSNKLNKDINVLIQKYCNNIHNLVEGKADLLIDKIIKAEILDQTQFKKHYLDNATGAIAGGMLLGAAGALLGGGTKTITESDKKYILAITYKSDDEIKYILFDVTANKVTAKNVIADINYRRTKIVENKRPKEKNL